MKEIVIAFFLSLFFVGCADKNNILNVFETDTSIEQDVDDEFSDFDDEFETKKTSDPLEKYNRIVTGLNDKIYIYILEPTASTYAHVVPGDTRVAIKNFIYNLETPVRFTNNLLQFKFERASIEGGRFVVNTIFGLGGFFDPAKSDLGWVSHDEDFGQTLGFYGMGDGIPIVLPLFGPSNIRDSIGLMVDSFVNPLSYMGHNTLDYKIPKNAEYGLTIKAYEVINKTSLQRGHYESIKKDALDLYPFLQDSYQQLREQQIKE
ncbi:MAG: VacJ family lipoprotein [Campylobacterales bacterium]|nr:VacJ family lipoprotein [Campylobacterales bacterium]